MMLAADSSCTQDLWSELDDNEARELWQQENGSSQAGARQKPQQCCSKMKTQRALGKNEYPGLKRRRLLGYVRVPSAQIAKCTVDADKTDETFDIKMESQTSKSADLGKLTLQFELLFEPTVRIEDVIGLVPQRTMFFSHAVGSINVFCEVYWFNSLIGRTPAKRATFNKPTCLKNSE